VLSVVVRQFEKEALLRLMADSGASPGWDPVSFGRSAIEPHEQDQHEDPFDPLIDAVRDCVEALLAAGDDRADAHLLRWAASEVPILRRLAVHGWSARTDVDTSGKIQWLLEKGFLYQLELRHEVFRLIQLAVPTLGHDDAAALVTAVASEPIDRANPDYERFSLLAWIVRHAPELRPAQDALLLCGCWDVRGWGSPVRAESAAAISGSWARV
jgi:hypothetical protein